MGSISIENLRCPFTTTAQLLTLVAMVAYANPSCCPCDTD